ncbi:helix-turn-helix domain-containing protein [Kitasatospora gansuensis]
MSIHLMLIAAYLPPDMVTPTEKLALMKICDSADEETRISRPGLHRLAAWTGISEKRTITLVTQLVKKGLVERIEVGKIGRTAVYRVFPLVLPTLPQTDELHERRKAASTAPRNPRLARPGVARSKPRPRRAPTWMSRSGRRGPPSAVGSPRATHHRTGPGFPRGNPVSSPKGTQSVPPGEPLSFLLFLPLSFLPPTPHG